MRCHLHQTASGTWCCEGLGCVVYMDDRWTAYWLWRQIVGEP